MLKIYKFYWDCGRQGSVEGIFVATQEEVEKAIGNYVYFGEILGKHSDIGGTLDSEDLTVVSNDQDFINKYVDIFGADGTGYNPLHYIQCSECDNPLDDCYCCECCGHVKLWDDNLGDYKCEDCED